MIVFCVYILIITAAIVRWTHSFSLLKI